MQIGAIEGATNPTRNGSPAQIGQDQFLALLTTQLKSQNPLEPMDNQQFLGQMVSLATLEQSQQVNANLQGLAVLQESLAALEQLTQGANLIGKRIEYLDVGSGDTKEGTVVAVRVKDGLVQAEMDDQTLVPLALVQAVKDAPAE